MKFSWAKLLNVSMIILALLLLASCVNNTISEPPKQPVDNISESPSISDNMPSIIEQETIEAPKVDISEVSKQYEAPHFIATEYQLLPPPEQNYDADFERFFNEFVNAVYSKDFLTMDGFLDDTILNSFGDGGYGKQDFYKRWNLTQDTEQSSLWIELEEIIRLGGVYNAVERNFVAPYIYSNFPDEFDAFEYFAIVGKEVNVYQAEDIESSVIDKLSYNIIQLAALDSTFWKKEEHDFILIQMPSGNFGYIQKQYVRSPVDYRLSFSYNDNGEWKMTFLVAGD